MVSSILEVLSRLKEPIAVFAHDAGAANHISAWFETRVMGVVQGSFDGPAREIFRKQCPWMEATHVNELLPEYKTLISDKTYAMVVALAAGRPVISSVPFWVPPCI